VTLAPRTLRVKCSTWDQVETFYVRKLRRGRTVTIRVPFVPEPDEPLSVALELPNDLVVVVDGTITAVQTSGDGRASIDIDLHGLSAEVIDRLEMLVKDGRGADGAPAAAAPAPRGHEQPVSRSDDPAYETVVQLDGELRRLKQLAVHEVLGVPWDASAVEVRAAWRLLCLRFHPDALAAHRSAAVSHLGEELMILVNRAYDRMRASLVADGRATAPGPALRPDKGWLVGFEALGTSELAITGLAAMAARGTGMTNLPPMGQPSAAPVELPIAVTSPASPSPPTELPPVPEPPRRRKAPTTGQPSVRFEQSTEHVFDELAVGTKAEASLDVARANAGDVFEKQARARIAAGDHVAAREVLAAALYVYPRNQMLRALYHVAAAMEALDAGMKEHAVAQLEAAMTADASCREASSALDELRRGRAAPGDVGRWFR
jgi:hypothetical protein